MKITQKTVMGAFIVAILVLSLFGFVLSYRTPDTNVLEYNGIRFRQLQQGWQATIADKTRGFVFHPLELEALTIDPSAAALLAARSIAITYDDNTTNPEMLANAQYYIEQTVGDQRIIVRGIVRTNSTIPSITCDGATARQPVILLTMANTTTVTTENNCIRIAAANSMQLIQYADVINYHILGVFNGK